MDRTMLIARPDVKPVLPPQAPPAIRPAAPPEPQVAKQQVAEPPVPAEIRSLPPRVPQRRSKFRWMAVLALAVLLIAICIGWLLRPQPKPRTASAAEPAKPIEPAKPVAQTTTVAEATPAVSAVSATTAAPIPQESVTPAPLPEPSMTPQPSTAAAEPSPAAAPRETRTEPRTQTRTPERTTPRTAERTPAPAATPRPSSKGSRVEIPVHLAGEDRVRREKDEPMKKGDLIMDGPGVAQAQLTESPPPSYPPGLAGSGRSAKVVLEVLVDENGAVVDARVRSATVDDGSADTEFRKAALAAARRARFDPATKNGIPGKMWGELSYEFGTKN